VKPTRRTSMSKWLALASAGVLAFGVAACGDDSSDSTASGGSGGGDLSGAVTIDGSSTVGPFAQAAAEQFSGENPEVDVSVGTSGTGGGFEKFCAGETDISDASRPIKADEEAPICKKNGITYQEIQVANDGIAIVTNKDLKIDCLTTAQLKKLWNTGSKVTNYNQLDPKFPDVEVSLYGPGTDSGTFDFFTDVVNGEEGVSRKEYQPSEDDNILVQGVSGDEGLAYFGFSYYEQNMDKLNLVGVDAGDGCVKPSTEAIQDGSYKPLSRPIFMYPSEQALGDKPQVDGFMKYVVDNEEEIATTSQIVPLTPAQIDKAKQQLQEAEAKAGK
jgi:phosphate transport system substrate-binding protein